MIKGIYRVAGPDITDRRDCNVYLIDGDQPVLIDAGFGAALDGTIANIKAAGVAPSDIHAMILTHCHIDHMGGAVLFRERLGVHLYMHELDADIVERGDNRLTAAFCFEVDFKAFAPDVRLSGSEGRVPIDGQEIMFIHTPGHTPGSISPYVDTGKARVLFGQDLGAPLLSDFDCDTSAWTESMEKLLRLEADVLCDGHSGIYQPRSRVEKYIRHFMKMYARKAR